MSELNSSSAPEEMIASLNGKRKVALFCAVGGVVAVLAVLFSAAGAMYSKDPVRELQTDKAALMPADR